MQYPVQDQWKQRTFHLKSQYRPTRYEVGSVVLEMFIMGLATWSFIVSPPSEAFAGFMNAIGLHVGSELMAILCAIGVCISPLSLVASERGQQKFWYRLAAMPLVFFSICIALYRMFIQEGTWTGIVVFLSFAAVLLQLAATTFRDPEPRRQWTRRG